MITIEKYSQWLEKRMRRTIEEYKRALKSSKIKLLSRAWNLPRATLQRRINGKVSGSKHASGRNQYLPEAAEKELAELLVPVSERGFLSLRGMSRNLTLIFLFISVACFC